MKALSLFLLWAPFLAGQTCQLLDLPSDASVDGSLVETDCAVKDFVRGETSVMRADAWKLTVREARVFRFRLTSAEIDSYLYILSDRLGLIAKDNDTGGGKDSEITVQLLPGTYTVLASMNAAGAGAYRLQSTASPVRTC